MEGIRGKVNNNLRFENESSIRKREDPRINSAIKVSCHKTQIRRWTQVKPEKQGYRKKRSHRTEIPGIATKRPERFKRTTGERTRRSHRKKRKISGGTEGKKTKEIKEKLGLVVFRGKDRHEPKEKLGKWRQVEKSPHGKKLRRIEKR